MADPGGSWAEIWDVFWGTSGVNCSRKFLVQSWGHFGVASVQGGLSLEPLVGDPHDVGPPCVNLALLGMVSPPTAPPGLGVSVVGGTKAATPQTPRVSPALPQPLLSLPDHGDHPGGDAEHKGPGHGTRHCRGPASLSADP